MSEKPDLQSLISSDMLMSLVAAVGVGVYVTDENGAAVYANDTMAIMLGYETEEQHLNAVKDIATEWYVNPSRRDEFKQLLDRLGDPFIAAQTAVPFTKQSGTGLGLAITHTLMQRMQGTLLAGNHPESGAYAQLGFREMPLASSED